MIRKKIASMFLTLTLVAGLGSGQVTNVKAADTKSVLSQMTAMSDVSDAKATGTFDIKLQGDEITESVYRVLKIIHFDVVDEEYSIYNNETGKRNITKAGTEFNQKMITFGLLSVANDDDIVASNNLNGAITIKSDITNSDKFTLDINAKVANIDDSKITSIKYDNGNITIDVKSIMKYVAKAADITEKQAYEYFEIPSINELSLDTMSELNSYLNDNIKLYKVLSYTVYTKEDGDEFKELIGQIKNVNYGERIKTDFNLNSTQFMTAIKSFAFLVTNTAESTFAQFETKSGTKATFHASNEQAAAFVNSLGKELTDKAMGVAKSIFTTIKEIPGADKVLAEYPNGYIEAVELNVASQITRIGKNLEQISTVVKEKGEDGKEVSYIPLEEILKRSNVNFDVTLDADTKGEKGYRDATFTGNIKLYEAETNSVDEKSVPTKIDIAYAINIKENGQAPQNQTNNNQTDKSAGDKVVKKGQIVKTNAGTFIVTSASNKTVEFKVAKNKKNIVVPATVTINGEVFKVTSISAGTFKKCKKAKKIVIGKNVTTIGKNAFKNCKGVKTVIIKSVKLKKIKNNAFNGLSKKAVIKCPKKYLKKYRKMIKKKSTGYKKSMTIKSMKNK